jgi:glycine/D-amino acid oxidase-like deaminating enzyme
MAPRYTRSLTLSPVPLPRIISHNTLKVRVERTDAAGSVVEETITAASVVLATGGYASDDAGPTSLLSKYRPDVASFGTTNGAFATGDGIKAALNVGARCSGLNRMLHSRMRLVLKPAKRASVRPIAFLFGSPLSYRLTLCKFLSNTEGAGSQST